MELTRLPAELQMILLRPKPTVRAGLPALVLPRNLLVVARGTVTAPLRHCTIPLLGSVPQDIAMPRAAFAVCEPVAERECEFHFGPAAGRSGEGVQCRVSHVKELKGLCAAKFVSVVSRVLYAKARCTVAVTPFPGA